LSWSNRGAALIALGRNSESIEFFDKALEIDPEYELALNNKGLALENIGRLDDAMVCYDAFQMHCSTRVISIGPTSRTKRQLIVMRRS
jgi:tetratricopeptide (TPR) repeat protein